jgi:hypothetical protein
MVRDGPHSKVTIAWLADRERKSSGQFEVFHIWTKGADGKLAFFSKVTDQKFFACFGFWKMSGFEPKTRGSWQLDQIPSYPLSSTYDLKNNISKDRLPLKLGKHSMKSLTCRLQKIWEYRQQQPSSRYISQEMNIVIFLFFPLCVQREPNTRFSASSFFHESVSSGPLSIPTGPNFFRQKYANDYL